MGVAFEAVWVTLCTSDERLAAQQMRDARIRFARAIIDRVQQQRIELALEGVVKVGVFARTAACRQAALYIRPDCYPRPKSSRTIGVPGPSALRRYWSKRGSSC